MVRSRSSSSAYSTPRVPNSRVTSLVNKVLSWRRKPYKSLTLFSDTKLDVEFFFGKHLYGYPIKDASSSPSSEKGCMSLAHALLRLEQSTLTLQVPFASLTVFLLVPWVVSYGSSTRQRECLSMTVCNWLLTVPIIMYWSGRSWLMVNTSSASSLSHVFSSDTGPELSSRPEMLLVLGIICSLILDICSSRRRHCTSFYEPCTLFSCLHSHRASLLVSIVTIPWIKRLLSAVEVTVAGYGYYCCSSSSSSSDSEVSTCSKGCMKAYANLKEEYDSLTSDYKKSQHNLFSYKAGLQYVEERLVHYKKNEVVFTEKINVLNLKVKLRDNVLAEYTTNLEKAEKERNELKLILEKLQNSSKSLNALQESQVSDKDKTRLEYKATSPTVEGFVNSSKILEKQENRLNNGYHEVPPPLTGNYIPSKRDLRLIDEHFEKLSPTFQVKIVKPSIEKIEIVKNARETVKTEESPKQHRHHPRRN
nr:hypothetical protein [Tanacetum cinerariifolium]